MADAYFASLPQREAGEKVPQATPAADNSTSINPRVQFEIGMRYLLGIGTVTQDTALGLEFLTKAAEHNYFAGIVMSSYYSDGLHCKPDYVQQEFYSSLLTANEPQMLGEDGPSFDKTSIKYCVGQDLAFLYNNSSEDIRNHPMVLFLMSNAHMQSLFGSDVEQNIANSLLYSEKCIALHDSYPLGYLNKAMASHGDYETCLHALLQIGTKCSHTNYINHVNVQQFIAICYMALGRNDECYEWVHKALFTHDKEFEEYKLKYGDFKLGYMLEPALQMGMSILFPKPSQIDKHSKVANMAFSCATKGTVLYDQSKVMLAVCHYHSVDTKHLAFPLVKSVYESRNGDLSELSEQFEFVGLLYLANCYAKGIGCEMYMGKAMTVFKQAYDKNPTNAKLKVIYAQALLFWELENDPVTYESNVKLGYKLIKECSLDPSAEQGEVHAVLGDLYRVGHKILGLEKDPSKAFAIFMTGANKHNSASCMFRIAMSFKKGEGVTKQHDMYKLFLEKAVQHENEEAIEEMQELVSRQSQKQ